MSILCTVSDLSSVIFLSLSCILPHTHFSLLLCFPFTKRIISLLVLRNVRGPGCFQCSRELVFYPPSNPHLGSLVIKAHVWYVAEGNLELLISCLNLPRAELQAYANTSSFMWCWERNTGPHRCALYQLSHIPSSKFFASVFASKSSMSWELLLNIYLILVFVSDSGDSPQNRNKQEQQPQ